MGFFDTLNAVKADLAFQKQDFETAYIHGNLEILIRQ